MEKSYYILWKENSQYTLGSIFESNAKENLTCLDNNKVCENITGVLQNCSKIDTKAALLLRGISITKRIELLNNEDWTTLTKLDVGDECFYISTNKETPCKITAKELGKKGVHFSILTGKGNKNNVTIDRLSKKKITDCATANNKNKETSSCKCLRNILQRAHSLELNLKERESLFKNLLAILPDVPEDDDKRCSIHWACYYLLPDSVEKLLDIKDDKNKQDNQGNTPFHLAITSPLAEFKSSQENLEKLVLILITHEVDISIRNKQKETPVTKMIKNGYFSILELVLKNYTGPFRLSDHFFSDKISILELLIKLNKYPLATLCCKISQKDEEQNLIFLKSASLALTNGMKDLCIEILEKATDLDEYLTNEDTFLTMILKDVNINSEIICFLLNSIPFKFTKSNKKKEYPLSLSCRRLLLDVVKVMFNRSFHEVSKVNDSVQETVLAYNDYFIKITYQSKKTTEFQSIIQVKQIAIGILDILLKNGANIDYCEPTFQNAIDNCVDTDFVKIVKHLFRRLSIKPTDQIDKEPIIQHPEEKKSLQYSVME